MMAQLEAMSEGVLCYLQHPARLFSLNDVPSGTGSP
jgi:hypothetical protein